MHESRPVIITAFANDRADGVRYLRNLPDEVRRVRRALEAAEELCEHIILPNATLEEVVDTLQAYRDRVAIFHYGGHANSYQLLLESSQGAAHQVQASGLAQLLGQQRGLQFVFLNGCSTELQTDELLAIGVPCVIATTQAIDDRVATELSERFYKGLASGASIATAFAESVAEARAATSSGHRLLASLDDEASDATQTSIGLALPNDSARFPWFIRYAPGAERTGDWNLPAAADNPLFGLPPLPQQDLPESPYRSLQWFRHEDADIFFGRGREVRDLFHLVTATTSPPIVLFYGLTGVGKSSVLDAGLLPRLSNVAESVYARRDAALGLTGTLAKILEVQAESSTRDAWRQLEQRRDRPLTIILDQVEEAFSRPRSCGGAAELKEFIEQLTEIFANPASRPRGRLVLGFRKEWLAEIDERLSEAKLPRSKVFLERLDRRGVIEVVSGPVTSTRLKSHYGLTIEESLPEIIADDLLADPGAPVAPTLQILLTRLWNEARRINADAPRIDAKLYQSMQRQGILLDDFLRQQLVLAEQQLPRAVHSGFLLDLLAAHTTDLGTAAQWSYAELGKCYATQAQSGLLGETLQLCQANYLLSQLGSGARPSELRTSLMHDTLAPLIRERHDKSDLPGQRARRILDSRVIEWTDGKNGNPLDAADLTIVEHGRDGTRSWSEDEQRLIAVSRQLQAKVEQQRKLWKGSVVAFVIALIITVGALWWQTSELSTAKSAAETASRNAEVAAKKANELSAKANASAETAGKEAATVHIMRATNVRSQQGDFLGAASHLAAASKSDTNDERKQMLGQAAASTLRGLHLDAIFDGKHVVFKALPVSDESWCIWSGFAGQSDKESGSVVGKGLTELSLANPKSGTAPVHLLEEKSKSAAVFVNDARTKLVRVIRDSKDGLSFQILDLRDPIADRSRNRVIDLSPSLSKCVAEDISNYRVSANNEWLLVWGKTSIACVEVATGNSYALPDKLVVTEGAIGLKGEWIWVLSDDRKFHRLRRKDNRFESTTIELQTPPDAQIPMAVDGRLLALISAGEINLVAPTGAVHKLQLPKLEASFGSTMGNGPSLNLPSRGAGVNVSTPWSFIFPKSGRCLIGWNNNRIVVWKGRADWMRDAKEAQDSSGNGDTSQGVNILNDRKLETDSLIRDVAVDQSGEWLAFTHDSFVTWKRVALDDTMALQAEKDKLTVKISDRASIRGLEFSPTGRTPADQRLLVWTTGFQQFSDRTEQVKDTFKGLGAAFVFNTTTGEQQGTRIRHSLPLQGACFGDSRDQIVTWSIDGQVRLWRLTPHPTAFSHEKVPADFEIAAASADGTRIAAVSSDADRSLNVVEINSPDSSPLPSPGSLPKFASLGFGESNDKLFVVQSEDQRHVWQLRDRSWETVPPSAIPDSLSWTVKRNNRDYEMRGDVPNAIIDSLASEFSEPNTWFFVRSDARHKKLLVWYDNYVRLIDNRSDEPTRRWTSEFNEDVDDAFLSLDGSKVIVRCMNSFQALDANTGQTNQKMLGLNGITGVQQSPSGKYLLEWGGAGSLLAAEAGGYARVWDWDLGELKPASPILRHDLPVEAASFGKDEKLLITSTSPFSPSNVSTVHVWDIGLGVEVASPLSRRKSDYTHIRFAADNSVILVWGGQTHDNFQMWKWKTSFGGNSVDNTDEVMRRTGTRLNDFGELEFLTRAEWEAVRDGKASSPSHPPDDRQRSNRID